MRQFIWHDDILLAVRFGAESLPLLLPYRMSPVWLAQM
jgi:hypothetical protein